MSMMLWKTLALGGVIGVGSVVVVQAKRSLDAVPSTAGPTESGDDFPLLNGEIGLETSFDGAGDTTPPKKLATPEKAAPLAEVASISPDENPFGGQSNAEVTQAAAETAEGGNPFAAAPPEQAAGQSEPATVTLDEPSKDQFALLDGANNAKAPQQSEPNPFGAAPAGTEASVTPLKKLSPGNRAPILRQTPTEEPQAAADDNPFSKFVRSPVAAKPEKQTAEVEPGSPQFDAPPKLDAPPPLRTREPAASASVDVPPASLKGEETTGLRSRREAPTQHEPDVATQQDAGLAAPQAPKLPDVAPDRGRGRAQVEDQNPFASPPPAKTSAELPPFPPELDLTGGERERSNTRPGEMTSIPSNARPVPHEPATTIPSDGPPVGFGAETTPAPHPNRDSFNPDESPVTRPGATPAPSSSIPGHHEPQGSPFDRQPPASIPTAPPTTPAPATPSELSGTGTIDRNVQTGPSQPQLTIIKQAPKEAVVGQDLEYSILVKNIGRSAANNVVVEDLIPRGSKCTGTIPKAESQLEKKNLIWKLGTLAAGAEQLIRVRITPTDAGEIGSVATVSFSAEVAAKTVIVEPKAQLTVSGPREAAVGEPAQFKFSITNNGPVDLKSVFIRTVLPAQGLTHPGGNDLEYEIGDLPRGKSRDVALSITPAQHGDWHFDSMITLGGRELAKAQAALHVVGARLTVVRSGPTKRFVGRSATYSNTVTNNSSQSLTNVSVVEQLPVGLEPSGQMSKDVHWDPSRRTLTWTIPQLAPGQPVDLPVTVTPKTAGNLQGQIVARDAAGNHAEIQTALEVAGFSSLVVDGGHDGRPVAVGDQVSFRFSVKNRGTAPAEQVVAMFDLPDEVEFVSAQGPGVSYQKTGRVVVFEPVKTVLVNGELSYDVVVRAKSATQGASRIQVSLNSNQLPKDRPLEQEQQLVIYGDDEEPQPVQRVSGLR